MLKELINLFIRLLKNKIIDVILAPSEVLFLSYDEEIYYLKRHGIKEGFVPIEIDKKLEDISYEIATGFLLYQLLFDFDNKKGKIFDKNLDEQLKNQLEIGRKFMDGYFDLHAIQEIDEKDCDNLEKELDDKIKAKEIEEIFKYRYFFDGVKRLIKKVDPFDLKVNFIRAPGEEALAVLYEKVFNLDNLDYECLLNYDDIGFIFSEISFNLDALEYDKALDYDKIFPTYIHELAHTQLNSIKGSCECYYNIEVISIFLELVSSFENDPKGDILRCTERMRLENLFDNIYALKKYNLDCSSACTVSNYIVSTLEAFRLFDEYQNKSNIYEKLDVMYGIQDIFDGKITVENFLKNNGINFSNSKDLGLVRRKINSVKGGYI